MTKKVIMPCGCTVQDIGPSLAMQWCPMHEAAPDMLEALTGHEDESLWAIRTIMIIINEYAKEHDWKNDDDAEATVMAILGAKESCENLMTAIRKAKGESWTTK